jgi:D-alanine transaminase
MTRVAYVNGQYLPTPYALISIDDRGYQFADGVYEVIYYADGHLVDAKEHLDRLNYSLKELHISAPLTQVALHHIIGEVIRRNRLKRGMVYIQMTRGVAERNHPFPKNCKASLVVTCRYFDQVQFMSRKAKGIKVITMPDLRWGRPDIKSIALLPNVLGKQQALESGAYDALLINQEGYITESNVANVWISPKQGILQTYPTGKNILNGITRQRLIVLATNLGYDIMEKPFTPAELFKAKEVFLSSSVSGLLPIVQVDQHVINEGQVGQVFQQLSEAYLAYVAEGFDAYRSA